MPTEINWDWFNRHLRQVSEGKSGHPKTPGGGFMGSGSAPGYKPVPHPTSFDPKSGHGDKQPKGATGNLPLGGAEDTKPFERALSAGCVPIVGLSQAECGRVWLRKVKANPGYPPHWTFPKGRIDKGETEETAAERETEEEAGLKVKLLPGSKLGTFSGTATDTVFFVGVVHGAPGRHDDETSEVRLVTWGEALKLIPASGNKRDAAVALRAIEWLRKSHNVEPLDAATKAELALREKKVESVGTDIDAAIKTLEGRALELKPDEALRGLVEDLGEQIKYLKALRDRLHRGKYGGVRG